ncbi:glycosyltransferase family 4 protein [uncultured Algoriphagus sp.]|uniref:glycosyltransferase family 4 protein n=1 Tax=uncultured Algoriphagus sp. TaxID=417365 RepID=UPI002593662F|nr:glycosyltransferase family 4 protein [uncultured Algoriphagus sp.]
MRILFLGETYRADAITWIKGIEKESGLSIETKELFNNQSRAKRILEAFRFFWSLIFSSERYDLVLAERSTSYGFFSLAVKAKVRVVAQQGISDIWSTNALGRWIKSILQRIVYRNVDLIHAWGYVMTYAMLQSGAPPHRILVRPKGLDLSLFTFSKKAINEKRFTLIVTRSLFPIYNHDKILEALAIIREKGYDFECIMIGDGVESERLIEMTSHLNLDNNIKWLGRIDNDDLPEYLSQADIYLAFPDSEGVSASLFEAMACGAFPIVTDLPANRAFIAHGQNGLLANQGDVQDLANKIERFMMNPSKYRKGVVANRKYIDEYCNRDQNMRHFFEVYSTLVKEKSQCAE